MSKKSSTLCAVAFRFVVWMLSWLVAVFLCIDIFTVKKPSELYPACLAAFGIAAALAGLCFAFKTHVREPAIVPRMLESAERFWRVALLSVLLLLIAFCKEACLEMRWFTRHSVSAGVVNITLGVLWCIFVTIGILTWYRGFDKVSGELRENRRYRGENRNPQPFPGRGFRRD